MKGETKAAPALAASSRLVGAEAEGDVDPNARLAQHPAGLEAVPGHGQLDRDIVGEGGELAAFRRHRLMFGGRHLGADRPLDDVADLAQHLEEIAARLGHEARVRGRAVDHAGCGQIADFPDVRRIDEKLHTTRTFSDFTPTGAHAGRRIKG